MPMIDAYASAGTFADKHKLAVDLASTLMRIEQVPDLHITHNKHKGIIFRVKDSL